MGCSGRAHGYASGRRKRVDGVISSVFLPNSVAGVKGVPTVDESPEDKEDDEKGELSRWVSTTKMVNVRSRGVVFWATHKDPAQPSECQGGLSKTESKACVVSLELILPLR